MLHGKEIREERKQGYLSDISMHTHKGICDKTRGKVRDNYSLISAAGHVVIAGA